MNKPVVAGASALRPAGTLRVGVAIAAFMATTLALLVFYLYVGVSGLRRGLLWSLLAAVPLSAVAGFVTWGAHRGRIAVVATFTLWGALLGVWGGTAAPWAPGRLRAEMKTIEVPPTYQFVRQFTFELAVWRRWRVLGTEAEVRTQMLQILVDEGFTLAGPADRVRSRDASRGRLHARVVAQSQASRYVEVTLVLGT